MGKDHSWHSLKPKVVECTFFCNPTPKGGSKQKDKVRNAYVQPLTHVLLCSVPRPAPLLHCLGNKTMAKPSRSKSKSGLAPVPWLGPVMGAAASWVSHGKVKIAQSCPTLCNSKDFTVHGILLAKILEWVAFPFSRGSSQPRDQTHISCIADGFFTSWVTRPCTGLAKNTDSAHHGKQTSLYWGDWKCHERSQEDLENFPKKLSWV